jgi:hypothetical protein
MNTLYTVDVWYTHRFNKTSICTRAFYAYENYFINFHTLLIRYSYVFLIRNCVTGP